MLGFLKKEKESAIGGEKLHGRLSRELGKTRGMTRIERLKMVVKVLLAQTCRERHFFRVASLDRPPSSPSPRTPQRPRPVCSNCSKLASTATPVLSVFFFLIPEPPPPGSLEESVLPSFSQLSPRRQFFGFSRALPLFWRS